MGYSPDQDLFGAVAPTADSPARDVDVVAPSDTVDLSPYAKSLKANAAGTIQILSVGRYQRGLTTPVPYKCVEGEVILVQVARVFATGTTLTNSGDLVALYR